MKGWLGASCVKRQTVFLLGFGLRMQVEDVSDFLVKVIKEEDFNFYDKDEVIFWYCYKNQMDYLPNLVLISRSAASIALSSPSGRLPPAMAKNG